MKVRMLKLNGAESFFTTADRKKNKMCSGYHKAARDLIIDTFPNALFYEEIVIRHRPNSKIIFDFFIPIFSMFIEVQGQQHFEYISHFHKSKAHYLHAKKLDSEKQEWCDLNEYKLVHFNFNESIKEWKKRLLS
jgi:hypothetical protein